MSSITYRIPSTPMIYVPGIVNWARHTESPSATLQQCLPDLPEAAIGKLVKGEFDIEGEDVLVTVENDNG